MRTERETHSEGKSAHSEFRIRSCRGDSSHPLFCSLITCCVALRHAQTPTLGVLCWSIQDLG